MNTNCSYCTDEQFNNDAQSDHDMTVTHFSSRSLSANFLNIKDSRHRFRKPFNVTAICETWLNQIKGWILS